MVEDVATSNVHIYGPKWVMQEDYIQVIFVLRKLFLKHVIPKKQLENIWHIQSTCIEI
jgi:hypothetical protein